MSADPDAGPARSMVERGRSRLRAALRAPFPILAGLGLCWALATPVFAVPDEPTQVIKAASVAHGELVGSRASGPYTAVHVPAGVVGTRYTCFVFQIAAPASCEPPLPDQSRTVAATTYAGLYPPLYYALVGWPTLLVNGDGAIYWMRVLTALLAALFLAAAFRSAASSRSRWMLPALAVVVTPYVLYFAGSVNASGLEMPVAICAWTSGLVLFGEPDRLKDRRLLARFVLALAVLMQVRGLGVLFGAVIVGTLAALFGLRPVGRLLGAGAGRVAAVVVGLSVAFSVVWTETIGGLALLGGRFVPPHASTLTVLKLSINRFGRDVFQMVGMFGWWNAQYLSHWVYWVWFAMAVGLSAFGLVTARGRIRLVAATVVVLFVALPVLIVAAEASKKGIVGQGRYWLPLVAGAVLVAAYAGRSVARTPFLIGGGTVAVLTGVLHIVAFRFILDRYRFGLSVPRVGTPWSPPLGAPVLMAAYIVLVLLFCSWWWRAARIDTAPRPRRAATTAAVVKVVLAAGAAAAAFGLAGPSGVAVAGVSTRYTWSGGDADTGGHQAWSDPRNWSGGRVPPGAVTGDDVIFPDLGGCGDADGRGCPGIDDLRVDEAHSLTIAGAYTLTSGSSPLTLGAGGLVVSLPSSRSRTTISIPIVLGAEQFWPLDRGTVVLDQPVSGGLSLTVHLRSEASLTLSSDLDVGDVNVIDVSAHGPRARVILNGGDLNWSSSSPVSVAGVALGGHGHLGPLTASDTTLIVGHGYVLGQHGAGVLTSSGDLSLDDSSSVSFDDLGSTDAPGDGFAQLRVAGNVTLGSAALRLDATCATVPGDAYPIVMARSVAGTFSRAGGGTIANGDEVTANPVGGRCSPRFKIVYTATTVTAVRVGLH